MNLGMRVYLDRLERDRPSEVVRIEKEVSPEYEIPAVLQRIEERGRQPVLIFENVRNLNGKRSELPVVINLFGARQRLADALGTTVARLALDYVAREKPLAPVVVDQAVAPVKQVVRTGADADLYELPVLTHHEMDLGPYLTSPSVWIKDLETGWTNCGILRVYVSGPRRMVVNFNIARHTFHYFQKYKAAGRDVPIVLVMGHHPAFYLGAQTKLLADEPHIIGGVMGQPLELAPSETWGSEIMVPAAADIVIEAEMSHSQLDVEGPFGEYTQYYGGQKLSPVEQQVIGAPMVEAYLYHRIKEVVPSVTAVHMPVSGTARLHAYIRMRKTNDGEPRTAIATALSSDYRLKHVVVVDEDVDIFDDAQVLWAIATRSQWDRDLMVLPRMMGTTLDPSADDILTAKGGIDATRPIDPRQFAMKLAIPEAVLSRVRLEDYLSPERLRRF